MLSSYAKTETTTVTAIGLMVGVTSALVGWWWLAAPIAAAAIFVIAFFRDPDRRIPAEKGIMVSPADGRISSIHNVPRIDAFDGPAVCVRIFLSVFNVHVNRSPCHAAVVNKSHRPGRHMNVLNPKSAEVNEACTLDLVHPVRRHPVAAVRLIAGMIARTIVTDAEPGRILQRGQRIGIIKFGSTVELYLPESLSPQVLVTQGQRVKGGQTILAKVAQPADDRLQPSATDPPTTNTTTPENPGDTNAPPERPVANTT